MFTPSEKTFSLIFCLIVIAELISGTIPALEQLHFVTKPAIVGSLLIFFWIKCKTLEKSLRLLISFALLFSLLGDVLLLFIDESPNYFLTGLIAFLIAHIMYVIAFLKHRNKALKPIGFVLILLAYGLGLIYVLKDGLNDMLVPVIIYMIVILSMASTAFLRQGKVSKPSFILVFVGALLFMISDSILALNKFYSPLAYANIGIMLTYALAQFSIVFGILKLSQKPR